MGLWLLAGAMAVAAPALKDGRKPVDQPAGDWAVVSVEHDGAMQFTERDFKLVNRTVVLRKNQMCILRDSTQIVSDKVAFYDNAGRLEVDLYPDDPKRLHKGICEVKDDELVICAAGPGADRPGDLAAPKGSGRTVLRLKRVDKK